MVKILKPYRYLYFRNYHEREIPGDAEVLGGIFMDFGSKVFGGEIDTITETLDGRPFALPIWGRIFRADMYRRGAAVRAAGEIREGQRIGHGAAKYTVTRLVANKEVEFTFHRFLRLRGTHGFVIRPGARPDTAIIAHDLVVQPAWFMLPLVAVTQFFHNAVIEDVFDAASDYLGFPPEPPTSHPLPVRVIARILESAAGQWVWTTFSSLAERVDPEWEQIDLTVDGQVTVYDEPVPDGFQPSHP